VAIPPRENSKGKFCSGIFMYYYAYFGFFNTLMTI